MNNLELNNLIGKVKIMNKLKDNKERGKQVKQYVIVGASVALLSFACTESAFAAFDLGKGIKAATDPLVAIITDYYGVGVALGASVGAIAGQGDLRTKSINAGVGAAVSGAVIFALLKALT